MILQDISFLNIVGHLAELAMKQKKNVIANYSHGVGAAPARAADSQNAPPLCTGTFPHLEMH